MSYDNWLEAPYQRQAALDDAYVTWCENNDLDPEGDHERAFEEAIEAAAEDAAEARAEARAEDYDY